MSCNQNCNQGRRCDCAPREPRAGEIVASAVLGLAMGAILALVYVYRTGGF